MAAGRLAAAPRVDTTPLRRNDPCCDRRRTRFIRLIRHPFFCGHFLFHRSSSEIVPTWKLPLGFSAISSETLWRATPIRNALSPNHPQDRTGTEVLLAHLPPDSFLLADKATCLTDPQVGRGLWRRAHHPRIHSLRTSRPPLIKAFDNGFTESDNLPVLLTDHGIIVSKDNLIPLFNCNGISFQFFVKRLTLRV